MVPQHLIKIIEEGVGTNNWFATRKRHPEQSMKGLSYDYRSNNIFKAYTGTGHEV